MPAMPSRPVPGSEGLSLEQVEHHNKDSADMSGAFADMVGEADTKPADVDMNEGGVFPVELNIGVKPDAFDLTEVVQQMDSETESQKIR